MNDHYNTVFRVEQFFENKGGDDWVYLYMIGYQPDPFWYPAKPFLEATNIETLKLACPEWVLRFMGYANIYAEGIEQLNIHNLTFSLFASGDVDTVYENLRKGLFD